MYFTVLVDESLRTIGHKSRNSRHNLEARLLSTAATVITEVASCAPFQVKGYEISQPRGSSVDPLLNNIYDLLVFSSVMEIPF